MKGWRRFWMRLIDLFLPRSPELAVLDEISAEEFMRRAERSRRGNEENILTVFSYKDPLVRVAIWQIKYRNHPRISRLLALILYSELIGELAELSQFANFKEPILIPIPMSPARQRSRGYNQTEKLAAEMMKLGGHQFFGLETKVLIKTKETLPQSSLPRTLRLRNLKDCFQIKNPDKIRNRNIILIDDVMTTGATIKEASLTLRRAGARKVVAIVIAH